MWIKTQDGRRVVKVDSIHYGQCASYYEVCGKMAHMKDGILLGSYDTEDQAREIMYDICEKIARSVVLYTMPENEEV